MEARSFGTIAAGAVIGLAALATPGARAGDEGPPSAGLETRFRQPSAMAFVDDGASLLVANRRSGSITVVDVEAARAVAEWDVGRGLADLAPLGDGRLLLAVDQGADELILLARRDRSIRVVDRLGVVPDPVRVLVLPGGSSCVVACRWSRRLAFVDVDIAPGPAGDPGGTLKAAGTIDLPFSPLGMIGVRDGARLVVADAFGGKLAVVDARRGTLEAVRALPAHNIRGLALAPDGRTLVVAHQVLSRLATTRFDDIHWGSLLNNHLRILRVDALLAPGPDADVLLGSRLIDLGEVGDGAGDPSGVAFDARGTLIVALSGVGEVAVGPGPEHPLRRVGVGRRPTAVVPGPGGETAYVADALDDTISVVEAGAGTRLRAIGLGPRPEPTAADRGERLFHDARLSHDGWLSCHSCHTDGHTNGLLGDTLGDGSYGAPKLVPSLLGTGATGPWGWLGGFDRLEAQVRQSIETTMRGPTPTDEQVADLTAYLRALTPPPARAGRDDDEGNALARGRIVFRDRGCVDCHAAPEYTSAGRYDVGLADEVGHREFNPPSLRGVGLRDRFLHDGRAVALEEVLREQAHPRGTELTPREIADLVAFLKSL